jgi:hypothetical protein
VQLAADGLSYQAIAEELGYSNKGTVHRLVGNALAKTRTEAVETMQRLEGERLDALQCGLWDKAMAGDVAAGLTVLRIVATRCRLFGLYAAVAEKDAAGPRTVVVPPEARD